MSHSDNPNSQHGPIIAVMGATGTGKSTFIKLVTRDKKIVVGHGTESKTDSIIVSCYSDVGADCQIMLVDTPGFDDSRDGHSDVDILRQIADFLMDGGGKELNGIIFMHRISDPRTGGTAKKNLRMFKELCGEKMLAHVVIVTTNWSRVTKEEGDIREKDLADGFFRPLMDAGARMVRHDDTFKGALAIMSPLLKKDGLATKIVDELREGKNLIDTSAGAALNADIKAMEARHMKEMNDLKEKGAYAKDVEWQRELGVEYRELKSKLSKLHREREKLKQDLAEQRRRHQLAHRLLASLMQCFVNLFGKN